MSGAKNALISQARTLLGTYAESELMIRAGLYSAGSDASLDEAVQLYPALDAFIARDSPEGCAASFTLLANVLRSPPPRAGQACRNANDWYGRRSSPAPERS